MLSLSLLVAACGGGSVAAPTPTASVAVLASTPSAGSEATATAPACELKCTVVKQQPKASSGVTFYSLGGQSTAAIEGLQIDLTCEHGLAVPKGGRSTDLKGFAFVVTVNEERTYTDTNQVYKVEGSLRYDASNTEKLGAYAFTVSGGKLSGPQTCAVP